MSAGVALLTMTAWNVSRRPPGIDADLVFWDEVRRGEFLYQVTAQGSLYAPEIRSVTNQSEGVIEAVHVLAGHKVRADDVLMVLSSPNLLQELADAKAELESALADEDLRQSIAKDELLRLESDLADAEDVFEEANFKAESSKMLFEQNAIIEMELMRDVNRADAARRRMDIANQMVTNYPEKRAAEDAQAESRIERQRRMVERLEERVRDLNVRAGFEGVVQVVSVEAGQRLGGCKNR
jgi:multidrug efflux pump subunit AcrA (membrane-fusion protein)